MLSLHRLRRIGLASLLLFSALQSVSSEAVRPSFVSKPATTSALPLVVVATADRGGGTEQEKPLTADTNSTDSNHSLAVAIVDEHNDQTTQRALHVRGILINRMRYMQAGKRSRAFARWVKDRKGEAVVFALNDPADGSADEVDYRPLEPELIASEVQLKRKDPFPPDRMNLDLFRTEKSPPNCFDGTTNIVAILKPPSTLQLCFRAIKLGIHFCPVLSTVGLAVISRKFREATWFPWLARCIGNSGAAWIKWGQWSSTRSDMFPDALCDQLATLHNDAPAHAPSFSRTLLEESLGLAQGTLDLVFDEFDETPIASGSIAQVHRAVLDGQPVAVKVRHPKVAELIDMDFRLMTKAARLFDFIPSLSWLHIRESVEQFSHTMAAQSYLNVEAHHLELLNYNFRKWGEVHFPRPFYASAACIIESYEPGNIVTSLIERYNEMAEAYNTGGSPGIVVEPEDSDAGGDPGTVSSEEGPEKEILTLHGYDLMPISLARFIVSTGLGLYLKMLLVDNLMHADLHPGNIMVDIHQRQFLPLPKGSRDDNQDDGIKLALADQGRVGALSISIVDAGMVARLTDDESAAFIGLLASVGEGDGREAAGFALQFSLENKMTQEEREAFSDDMVELFAERCRGYGTNVDVGHALRGILGMIRKHRVRIDANFATLAVNCLCLESLGKQIFPSYNVLDFAKPLLQTYRRMCYTKDGTPIPEARRSKWVLFKLSFNYLRKSRAEAKFFRQWSKRNTSVQRQFLTSLEPGQQEVKAVEGRTIG